MTAIHAPSARRTLVAAVVLAASPWSALAAPVLDSAQAKSLFNTRGCNACHEAEEQRIGPSYQVVALRYAGERAADPVGTVDKLAAKIRHGGAGAWGSVPMVSNPAISAAEAESISRWILDYKAAAPATP